MELPGETYLFEAAIGFKLFSWAFFEKMHFEKSIFLFQKYLGFKKIWRTFQTFVFFTNLIFQLPFGVTEL